jgi:hypothetical protein
MLQVEQENLGKCSQLSGTRSSIQTKADNTADCASNPRITDKTRRHDLGSEAARLLQKLQGIASVIGKLEAQRQVRVNTTHSLARAPTVAMPSSKAPASLNVSETAGGALADGAA